MIEEGIWGGVRSDVVVAQSPDDGVIWGCTLFGPNLNQAKDRVELDRIGLDRVHSV